MDGGVTVDLRSLNSFKLSADKKTASIGGGSVWSETVYPNLDRQNLTAPGGRITGVGVGGFLTGGGLNFLGRRDGFACDSVRGYEVVLGTGKVVYASAESNRDLWLALKGGSNNFGIVTRFDIATYPQTEMLGGFISFNFTDDTLKHQAKAISSYMDPRNFDPLALLEVNFAWFGGAWLLSDALFYLEPNMNPTPFKDVLAIPGRVETNLAISPVTGVVTAAADLVPKTVNCALQLTYTFKTGDASVYYRLFTSLRDGVNSFPAVDGLLFNYLVQPLPTTNGTNSLGVEPNRKDLVIVDLAAAYNNVADDAIVINGLQAIFDQHVKILKEAGLFHKFIYLNYAGDTQDPIGSYGTLEQLRRVSRKYDPQGLFQKAVPGPWKLFK
ncbi:hypothetical protein MFIFM68171_04785 [Madurella fahalii]|uniref:FAD-binding PCMH-type domain-containing protein n=1 Tax=Madurella fahalii TaxID=1157608 RepID=A0ABQ0GA47_9PEZI